MLRLVVYASLYTLGLVILAGNALAAKMTINRQILLPDGKPAAGARVVIRTYTATEQFKMDTRVVTNANGVFTAEVEYETHPHPAFRSGYIIVDAPYCSLALMEFRPWGAGDPLRLSKAYTQSGTVVDLAGKPIANAQIHIGSINDGGGFAWAMNVPARGIKTPEFTAVSNEQGVFALRGITIERTAFVSCDLWMQAEVDGQPLRGAARSFSFWPQGEPKDRLGLPAVFTLSPTLALRGRVLNALTGAPVAGASVKLDGYRPESFRSLLPVVSGPDGTFTFRSVPAAEQLFAVATHPQMGIGWKLVAKGEFDRGVTKPITTLPNEVVLSLHPMTTVTGRVIDRDTGQPPVPVKMAISVEYEGGYNDGRIALGRGATGTFMKPDGTFSLITATGANTFLVTGPGYWRDEVVNADVEPDGTTEVILKVYREKGQLIRFEGNAPDDLQRLNVSVRKVPDGQPVTVGGASGIQPGGYWFYSPRIAGDNAEYQVTRGGKVVVPWTRLTMTPADWPQVVKLLEPVEPIAQPPVAPLPIGPDTGDGYELKGRIVNAVSGAPVMDAEVKLYSYPTDLNKDVTPVRTNTGGYFTFHVKSWAEQFLVTARSTGYVNAWMLAAKGMQTKDGIRPLKDQPDIVTLKMREKAVLYGRIVERDSGGRPEPVPLRIAAVLDAGGQAGIFTIKPTEIEARMRPDGTFEIEAAVGNNTFTVSGMGYVSAPMTLQLRPGGNYDQVLQVSRAPGQLFRFLVTTPISISELHVNTATQLGKSIPLGDASRVEEGGYWFCPALPGIDQCSVQWRMHEILRFALPKPDQAVWPRMIRLLPTPPGPDSRLFRLGQPSAGTRPAGGKLADASRDVRIQGVQEIAARKDQGGLPSLFWLLKFDDDSMLRRKVIEALAAYPPNGTQTISEAIAGVLYDADSSVQAAAIATLQKRGEYRAAEMVLDQLYDENPSVRLQAARYLTGISGELRKYPSLVNWKRSTVETLKRITEKEPDAKVRAELAEAIRTLGGN
ncbi:MAG: HEAT repeat domain-containing protein [Armatimonadota bacterium]